MSRAAGLALAVLLHATPAAAEVPEALRGAWVQGADCDRPVAALFVTAGAVARVPLVPAGPPALQRFARIAPVPGGWSLGTEAGPGARRLGLRMATGGMLELVEPEAKTRDDRLPAPGATALPAWRRCPARPAALAAAHAEGFALLAGLERVAAACVTPEARACAAAVVGAADVSGDGLLSIAELARLARGAAWADAAAAGAGIPAGTPARALAAARALVETRDDDGDGRLAAAELSPDRASPWPAAGAAEAADLAALLAGLGLPVPAPAATGR